MIRNCFFGRHQPASEKGIADVNKLPFLIKILVENLLRKLDGRIVRKEVLDISSTQDVIHVKRSSPIIQVPMRIFLTEKIG